MNIAQQTRRSSSWIMRGLQYLYLIIAWLFVLGVACQAYLAGLGIFSNASWFEIHGTPGFMLGDLSLPMLLLVFLGRFPRKIVLPDIALLLDMLLQILLVTAFRGFKQPFLTALHPANALCLFLISLLLASTTLRWMRINGRTGASLNEKLERVSA